MITKYRHDYLFDIQCRYAVNFDLFSTRSEIYQRTGESEYFLDTKRE